MANDKDLLSTWKLFEQTSKELRARNIPDCQKGDAVEWLTHTCKVDGQKSNRKAHLVYI